MEVNLSRQLVQLIADNQALVQPFYTIQQSIAPGKVSHGFHTWANGKRTTGGFLIRNSQGSAYWLLFIDWYDNNDYYLILFRESQDKPLAETHQVYVTQAGEEFYWNYRPVKRDGKNDQ